MKSNSRLTSILVSVCLATTTIVFASCGKPNSMPHYDETTPVSNILSNDFDNPYPKGVNPNDLPSLDRLTLPKVTGTQIELSLSFIPKDIINIPTDGVVSIFSFTNIRKGIQRIKGNTEEMTPEIYAKFASFAPDFLLQRMNKPEQPVDNPENWSWMVNDRQSGGTWLAGNLELGERLLPGMSDGDYIQERLPNSIMVAFISTSAGNAPYGKQVVPFAPTIGYFNNSNINLEQADSSGMLIRNKDITSTAETKEMKEILPFVGDAENASFIKSHGTLENVIPLFGIPSEMAERIKPTLEKLKGLGRNEGLDWIVFSHNPEEEYPIRIILRYESQDHAVADMMGLKYIKEQNIVYFNNDTTGAPIDTGLSMERFTTYNNIGLIECKLDNSFMGTPEPMSGQRNHEMYRSAEFLTEMYTKGMLPQLLKND